MPLLGATFHKDYAGCASEEYQPSPFASLVLSIQDSSGSGQDFTALFWVEHSLSKGLLHQAGAVNTQCLSQLVSLLPVKHCKMKVRQIRSASVCGKVSMAAPVQSLVLALDHDIHLNAVRLNNRGCIVAGCPAKHGMPHGCGRMLGTPSIIRILLAAENALFGWNTRVSVDCQSRIVYTAKVPHTSRRRGQSSHADAHLRRRAMRRICHHTVLVIVCCASLLVCAKVKLSAKSMVCDRRMRSTCVGLRHASQFCYCSCSLSAPSHIIRSCLHRMDWSTTQAMCISVNTFCLFKVTQMVCEVLLKNQLARAPACFLVLVHWGLCPDGSWLGCWSDPNP